MMKRTLVIYYSFSNGNTKKIASELQKALDADIAEIETVVPYPPYGGFNSAVVSQGQQEVEDGYCPEIKPLGYNINDYDVIAIGTPTWWYTMAPAMLTFLKSENWKDKTVIPFMTHGGWPGHVIKDIKTYCKGAEFKTSLEVQFDSQGGDYMLTKQSEITKWVGRIAKEINE